MASPPGFRAACVPASALSLFGLGPSTVVLPFRSECDALVESPFRRLPADLSRMEECDRRHAACARGMTLAYASSRVPETANRLPVRSPCLQNR
jgi:hypothetical protein